MLTDVGKGAAGKSEHVGSVRIQCNRTLSFVMRVFSCSFKVVDKGQVRPKGVDQRYERTGESEVRVDRNRLARPAQRLGNRVLVPALHGNGAGGPTKLRPGIK